MKNLWISFSVILLGIFVQANATTCKPSAYSPCEYFSCEEKKYQCGEEGYFLRHGLPYCNAFLYRDYESFTDTGKKFLTTMISCLQGFMHSNILTWNGCEEIDSQMLSVRSSCLVNSGLCELPFIDKLNMAWIMKKQITDPRMYGEFIEVMEGCLFSL